jgi:hypothetical protein
MTWNKSTEIGKVRLTSNKQRLYIEGVFGSDGVYFLLFRHKQMRLRTRTLVELPKMNEMKDPWFQ